MAEVQKFPDLVSLNVGGKKFKTYLRTLRKFEDSTLGVMFSGRHNLPMDEDGSFFIDRDPKHFETILNYLRTDTIVVPDSVKEMTELVIEAGFYQLEAVVEAVDHKSLFSTDIGEENAALRAQDEELRRLFATDRDNPKLDDPHVGLVNVYKSIEEFYPLRDKSWQHLRAPLIFDFVRSDTLRGPSVAHSFNRFNKNWHDFSCDSFHGFDWSNIVAAGGSVLACLLDGSELDYGTDSHSKWTPATRTAELAREKADAEAAATRAQDEAAQEGEWYVDYWERRNRANEEKRQRQNIEQKTRRFQQYRRSDVDLFLVGLKTEEDAVAIVRRVYEQLKSNYTYLTAVRSKYAVSFLLPYPLPTVQIVLRMYKSVGEVLCGFDIDSCCCAFDGRNVFVAKRARRAINGRINLVDPERMSTTYERRLFKYTKRGFAISVPGYDPQRVDQSIFESTKPISAFRGMAKLLLLEKKLELIYNLDPKQPHSFEPAKVAARLSSMVSQSATEDVDEELRVADTEGELFEGRSLGRTEDEDRARELEDKERKASVWAPNRSDYVGFRYLPTKNCPAYFAVSAFILGAAEGVSSQSVPIVFTQNNVEKVLDTGVESGREIETVCYSYYSGRDKTVKYKLADDVPHKIEFLKINPGAQESGRIGSFKPVSHDFFIDCWPKLSDQTLQGKTDTPQTAAAAGTNVDEITAQLQASTLAPHQNPKHS